MSANEPFRFNASYLTVSLGRLRRADCQGAAAEWPKEEKEPFFVSPSAAASEYMIVRICARRIVLYSFVESSPCH